MKEIGGYFELDKARGREYHQKAIAVNSGRHALEYIIRSKGIKKLFLPSFLCLSVADRCHTCGCDYELYEINEDFTPCFEKELQDGEYLYIVNYYGQLSNERLLTYKNVYKNMIVDNAQAFFQMPVEGVDTVYTCRKFFGVSDGGYVYTEALLQDELETDVSYERIQFVLGRFELDAGTFYQESVANNHFFKTEKLKKMSLLTQNLLKGLDYAFIEQRRRENFSYLHKQLQEVNALSLTIPEGPFMYPLYVKNGDEIKKKLIEHKLYVPTLWPDVFSVAEKNSVAWDYAQNIVPIPCDQRYDAEDMEYIVTLIKEIITV